MSDRIDEQLEAMVEAARLACFNRTSGLPPVEIKRADAYPFEPEEDSPFYMDEAPYETVITTGTIVAVDEHKVAVATDDGEVLILGTYGLRTDDLEDLLRTRVDIEAAVRADGTGQLVTYKAQAESRTDRAVRRDSRNIRLG